MRKVSVDIFFCERKNTKKAIMEYLQSMHDLKGMECPSVILLGSEVITKDFDGDSVPVYRLFSVQRQTWYTNKIVVNVVKNYYL